ncbi:MAG TPA: CBS domain-containing protein [Cyanobacteria bacterium UBA8530]|nr:CBS domain-containing protein [Cyanobacteria bacterium UBA8530]
MKLRDLMSKQVVKVSGVTMLPEVAKKMKQENIGMLPVEENGKLIGVVTDRDITIDAVAQGNINRPVKDIISANPVTVGPETTVEEALKTMTSNNVRRLPVVENNQLVGIISLEDLVEGGNPQMVIDALKRFHQNTKHH